MADSLHGGFFGPGTRYFLTSSQGEELNGVIDTKQRELAATDRHLFRASSGPGAVDPKRYQAFTTHLDASTVAAWDPQQFELKQIIDTPGKGPLIPYLPDSRYVWADVLFTSEITDSLVESIDPDTLEVAMVIATEQWSAGRSLHPEFTLDGSEGYFSLRDANTLVVLESDTGRHVATMTGSSRRPARSSAPAPTSMLDRDEAEYENAM